MRFSSARGLVAGALTLFACGCGQGAEGGNQNNLNNQNNNSGQPTATYSGSAAHGDLVVFEVDEVGQTYTIYNETTGTQASGSYSLSTVPQLQGVWEVSNGTETSFAVNLPGTLIAANFDTGRLENNISFGVNAELDNTGKVALIQGNYIYIGISNEPLNGSTDYKEWGILTVGDGTWVGDAYATGGLAVNPGDLEPRSPEEATLPVPATGTMQGGDWSVNGVHKERLDVTVAGAPGALTGYVYADNESAAFLLDLGEGNGFYLALKIPDAPLSRADVAGTYKMIQVTGDGLKAAVNVDFPASGDATYFQKYHDGTTVSGVLTDISFSPSINNTLSAKEMFTGGYNEIVIAMAGDAALYFMFECLDSETSCTFIGYGAGARL